MYFTKEEKDLIIRSLELCWSDDAKEEFPEENKLAAKILDKL